MGKTILFDLDGTLTDSGEGIINCATLALHYFGLPVPDRETMRVFVGPPLDKTFMKFGVPADKTDEAIAVYRSRYTTIGKFENAAVEGGPELCRRLKERGYVLALASSKPEEMCLPICEKFGYAPYLDVITGSQPGRDWEKVDVIRETMRRLNLTEADVPSILMVGDRKFDVLGAKEFGMDCVGVEFFGYAEPGELAEAGAVAVVQTPDELEAFILNH